MNIFRNIAKAYGSWVRYNSTVRELNSLSNRDLQDLGMHRHEIRAIARNQARG